MLGNNSQLSEYPELIFGLVAPIGVDLTGVENALKTSLKSLDYNVYVIHLSTYFKSITTNTLHSHLFEALEDLDTYSGKIQVGNKLCEVFDSKPFLAGLAISKILNYRKDKNADVALDSFDNEVDEAVLKQTKPIPKTAYIIRQFKREAEVLLFRKIYGEQFIQVSANADLNKRLENLKVKIGDVQRGLSPDERDDEARRLIRTDANDDHVNGQNISDIFHMADVFVDANNANSIEKNVKRFIFALFGNNYISPTKDEYGSFFAKAASLKTVDLSRQVGAAIFTQEGDIVTTGCNEVPKAGGGLYWEDDTEKYRDIDVGIEANKAETNRIVYDFLKRMNDKGLMNNKGDLKSFIQCQEVSSVISESMIGEITEYGRMVHAEMNAITDAARLGRPLKGNTIYVTTYPCHNCAKHIIASGLSRVVFIEPYPKSRAQTLFPQVISDSHSDNHVHFSHFYGISPKMYNIIFEKKEKRRRKDGSVKEWYLETAKPMIEANTIKAEMEIGVVKSWLESMSKQALQKESTKKA